MIIRTLTSDWDFKFGHSKADYASESLCTAYDIKMQIQSWYYDCFFNIEAGIDWKNLLGSKESKKQIDTDIKNIINNHPYVENITFFESSIINRVYTMDAKIKTTFGDTIEVQI